MTQPDYEKSNPILYYHKEVPVRKYNTVNMRIDEITYKELIDSESDTGLSLRKIIGYSSTPCEKCVNTFVVVRTENGQVKVKRGILSKRIPGSNGINKITKNAKTH